MWVLSSSVLASSLSLIQVLTLLMTWRGFLVASWCRYASSFLKYPDDCSEEFIEFVFLKLSGRYPLRHSNDGDDILIGGVVDSFYGTLVMDT